MSVFIPQDPYNKVVERLWIGRGGCGPPDWMGGVVSLFSPSYVQKAEHPMCRYLYIPMEDSKEIPERDLEMTSSTIARWHIGDERDVLVRCQAGLNRSALVLGHYMITKLGIDNLGAFNALRNARGVDVLHNFFFRKYIFSLSA